jgi:multidrug efflux pump subunit AcrA (membrane-fusion protein)
LQTEVGYPHTGRLDYVAPTVNQGTLAVRGFVSNADRALLPGFFVRVRVPLPIERQQDALLVPDTVLGTDQSGRRYLLIVTSANEVEQRAVTIGPIDNGLRVIETGVTPGDRVIIADFLQVIPGDKVDPQLQKISLK